MQTEMQATIAFACYDNDEVLKDGRGMNKKSQVAKILELYIMNIECVTLISFCLG